MTVVTGTALDAAGAAVDGAPVTARLVTASTLLAPPGGQIIAQAQTAADAAGAWALDLTPTTAEHLAVPGGAHYEIFVGPRRYLAQVPNTGPVELGAIVVEPVPLDPLTASAAALAAHAAAGDAHGIGELTAADVGALPATGGIITGDVTIADPGVKGYRFRRSGGALDNEATGADWFISVWTGTAYDGTQRYYFRLEAGAHIATTPARWRFAQDTDGNGLVLDVDPAAGELGFYGAPKAAQPAVTGSRGGNAALASLLSALATLGLIDDQTSA